jgi:predicted 2-oxoglutarate/Fe(II)-dependent dioxygenase YbiX
MLLLKEVIKHQVFTIENFFTPDECHELIAVSEGNVYDDAPVMMFMNPVQMPEVRNNKRVIIDDVAHAEKIWKRLQPIFPPRIGNYDAIGLNERFRFYRYDVGEYFAFHHDGSYQRHNGEESLMTFMIYLNDDFTGGETTFDFRYPLGEFHVVPKQGMALIFIHALRHKGSEIKSGRKYVLRSDVMYRNQS